MFHYNKLSLEEANLVDQVAAQFGGYKTDSLKEALARLLLTTRSGR